MSQPEPGAWHQDGPSCWAGLWKGLHPTVQRPHGYSSHGVRVTSHKRLQAETRWS
jgi:hypothetical protein